MKTFYLLLLTCSITLLSTLCSAQRNCTTDEYLLQQIEANPERGKMLQQIEKFTSKYLSNSERSTASVTIPIVVHVVYNNANENISDAQIQTQIDVLNEDFRRLNSDADNTWSQAVDSDIEFCLATVDPNGNATNGITRTSTSVSAFGTNDQVKFNSSGGKDAWPASDYLNVWVCDISGGILGYAQFPGGPANTDGVVNDYQYFGTIGTATAPFNLGRTMTHEVGHYLNLRHIWGDGGCGVDDFVSDTPESDGPNYGCALGHTSCGSTDMVQNYMDYSDDACMNLYTAGQKARMQALFAPGGFRNSLLSSSACGSAPPPPPGCEDNEITLSITLDNYPEETSWTISNDSGATVASGGTYGSQPDGSTVSIDLCLIDGCYSFNISDSYGDGICCAYGNGSYLLTNGNTTLASGGQFASSESTNFCLGSTPGPSCNDGVQNGNETGVDCGGPDCDPCNTGGCSYATIDFNNFDSGWGIWNDGGSDCRRSANDAAYADSQPICVRLRDNTSSSTMTTDNLNLSTYEELTVDFTYYPRSMDNSNEDFWLQISLDGGASYTTVEEWNRGDEFENNQRYFDAVVIPGPFTNNTRLRFRCDASGNSDWIYIDDVEISGCNSGNTRAVQSSGLSIGSMELINLFPNPASDRIQVNLDSGLEQDVTILILDAQGRAVKNYNRSILSGITNLEFNIDELSNNLYFLKVVGLKNSTTQKFMVIKN